jgi:hypothetical protein
MLTMSPPTQRGEIRSSTSKHTKRDDAESPGNSVGYYRACSCLCGTSRGLFHIQAVSRYAQTNMWSVKLREEHPHTAQVKKSAHTSPYTRKAYLNTTTRRRPLWYRKSTRDKPKHNCSHAHNDVVKMDREQVLYVQPVSPPSQKGAFNASTNTWQASRKYKRKCDWVSPVMRATWSYVIGNQERGAARNKITENNIRSQNQSRERVNGPFLEGERNDAENEDQNGRPIVELNWDFKSLRYECWPLHHDIPTVLVVLQLIGFPH